MKKIELCALPVHAGRRMDLFLNEMLPEELSRNTAQRLCSEGSVLVGQVPAGKNYRLRGNELVTVYLRAPKPLELKAQDIPLDIVYEDKELIVVNKQRGMVVHPAPGNEDGTLVNALLFHCGASFSGIGGVERPGIVHRIDKMTSGLLVVAKTAQAHDSLSRQIKEHSCKRCYEAVVHGNPREAAGSVRAPIGRHPVDRKRMHVSPRDGREAVTHYRVLERFRGFCYLKLELETGRTHQIRVHMAHIGHPVAGDMVYGPKKGVALGGQCLHARTLELTHPTTGERHVFSAELPEYFLQFLDKLRGMV